ncbi:MAG: hypothetical protein RX318_09520 [bacterium]|nr:hypothetical protein [bacterium]
MRKIYFDTNTIDRMDESYTAQEFESLMASQGLIFTIGIHLIYEMGRGFSNPDKVQIIRRRCGFLFQLENLNCLQPTEDLIKNEIIKVQTGASPLNILTGKQMVAAKYELGRMAEGLTEEAKQFIEPRELRVEIARVKTTEEIIRREEEYYRDDPERPPIPRSFTAYKNSISVEECIRTIQDGLINLKTRSVSENDLRRVLGNSEDYPIINTWLNSNIYLNWIPAYFGVPPAKDKISDFRHIINSCASNLFVSADGKLIKSFNELSPLSCLGWDEFIRRLEENVPIF